MGKVSVFAWQPRLGPTSQVSSILDEPSIGSHQRDNDRLTPAPEKDVTLGNTNVVEHDEDTMREADYSD